MLASPLPGEAPVSLNEARGWLRLGTSADDAVVAALVRAATNICEAFVGQWLVVRAAEEVLAPGSGPVTLGARPVVAVDAVFALAQGGGETALDADGWRLEVGRDGTGRVRIDDPGDAVRLRIAYRAGMAAGANAIPEAIRQGILRMTQHLHDARDGEGAAPPAAIAALWQPWRRIGLGGGR
ncbi:MAG: hypothetical protein HEQ22_13005 [Sphingopyxis sp.]|uniref:head-tail connector protein n=1 Tax=Sphingopyxis sp. TaxID=1908224 RepID=UPI003D80B6A6